MAAARGRLDRRNVRIRGSNCDQGDGLFFCGLGASGRRSSQGRCFRGLRAVTVPPATGRRFRPLPISARAAGARCYPRRSGASPKAHRIEGSVRLGTAGLGKEAIRRVVKNPRGARIGRVNHRRMRLAWLTLWGLGCCCACGCNCRCTTHPGGVGTQGNTLASRHGSSTFAAGHLTDAFHLDTPEFPSRHRTLELRLSSPTHERGTRGTAPQRHQR